jgi:hypothetical protein
VNSSSGSKICCRLLGPGFAAASSASKSWRHSQLPSAFGSRGVSTRCRLARVDRDLPAPVGGRACLCTRTVVSCLLYRVRRDRHKSAGPGPERTIWGFSVLGPHGPLPSIQFLPSPKESRYSAKSQPGTSSHTAWSQPLFANSESMFKNSKHRSLRCIAICVFT